jgi:hypothetical protein
MTFKLYNPHTKKQIWQSINASGAKFDGLNCKADQFVSDPVPTQTIRFAKQYRKSNDLGPLLARKRIPSRLISTRMCRSLSRSPAQLLPLALSWVAAWMVGYLPLEKIRQMGWWFSELSSQSTSQN